MIRGIQHLLQSALKVRPEESAKTALAFLYLFCGVGAFIVGRIARTVLFLELPNYEAQLPRVYIIIAISVSITMMLYARVERRLRRDHTNMLTTALLIVGNLGFRAWLSNPSTEAYWAFYVWTEIYGTFLIVQFWSLMNEVFYSRQAKRLFAVVGGGGVLSNVFVGFGTKSLVPVIGTENLLYVIAGLLAVSFLALAQLGRLSRQELVEATIKPKKKAVASASALSSRHVKLVAAIVALTYLVSTFVDYQFQIIIGQSIEAKDARSAFFGAFFGYTGILAALIQFTATARLLERFGVLLALMLLPSTMLLGTTGLLTLPTIYALWAVSVTKGSENCLRYTINDATLQLLYLPLPASVRGQAKAWIDGVLKPISIGVAGAMLSVLVTYLTVQQLSAVVLAGLAVWCVVVVLVRKEYVKSLVNTLHRRQLDFDSAKFEVQGEETLGLLRRALGSPELGEILHGLDMVGYVSPSQRSLITPHVVALLEHPSPEIRGAALLRLCGMPTDVDVEQVRPLLHDASSQVRAKAVMLVCMKLEADASEQIQPLLTDTDLRVRSAAVAGLVKYGGLDGILMAADTLKSLLNSANPNERERAAWILGEINVQQFYQPLVSLLHDTDENTQLAAIAASEKLRNPRLISILVEPWQRPRLQRAANQALSAYGVSVLPAITEIVRTPETRPSHIANMAQVLSRIDEPEAVAILVEMTTRPAESSVQWATKSLYGLCKRSPKLQPAQSVLRDCAKREAIKAYTALHRLSVLAPKEDEAVLRDALEHRANLAIERALMFLGLQHGTSTMELVRRHYKSANKATRANAVEVLENLLGTEEKAWAIPLVDDIPLDKKLQLANGLLKDQSRDADVQLRTLLTQLDPWLQTCALYVVGRRKLRALVDPATALLDHADSVVRETAIETLRQLLERDRLDNKVGPLTNDPARQVARYAAHVLQD